MAIGSFRTRLPPEDKVYVTEVRLTKDDAEAEAARLNELAADKRSRYVVHYTRPGCRRAV
jgi:hypothetical protein